MAGLCPESRNIHHRGAEAQRRTSEGKGKRNVNAFQASRSEGSNRRAEKEIAGREYFSQRSSFKGHPAEHKITPCVSASLWLACRGYFSSLVQKESLKRISSGPRSEAPESVLAFEVTRTRICFPGISERGLIVNVRVPAS